MAVVTLCRAGGAQLRDLAVEGVEESRCLFVVAAPALVHHQKTEVGSIGATDVVRGVTVLTAGFLVLLRILLPMDALLELIGDN